MLPFLTLDDVNVTRQNVLLRLDLNLPMNGGEITDSERILRSLPTIEHLLKAQAKVIILSHFGRPKGQDNPKDSLGSVATKLHNYIKAPIFFSTDCIGEGTKRAINLCPHGGIILLENLRFHPQEEANDADFARELASLGDIYVNDAFSCSHRAHASVVGIAEYLPAVAGRAMEMELKTLGSILTTPERPIMAIVGGSKVSTKLDLLNNLITKMDYLALGGGMANTFLTAQGLDVGTSLKEDALIPQAREILELATKNKCQIILPVDAQVSHSIDPGFASRTCDIKDIKSDEGICDMGPASVSKILETLKSCKTVIWNGPVGIFELPPFDQGSVQLAKGIAKMTGDGLISVAGGGDTLAALHQAGCGESLTYSSTAGGAFLEWLEGKVLPGINTLSNRRGA